MKCTMTKTMLTVAALLAPLPLYAQEAQELTAPMASSSSKAAPSNAFELMLGFGYEQGFGTIGDSQPKVNDLISAGGEIQLGLGWRINPRSTVGIWASGGKNGTQDLAAGGSAYTAGAGIESNYHFLPENDWDPWIGLAFGYRGLWVTTDQTSSWQGIGSRLSLGVDFRVSRELAVGPYIAAGTNIYFHEDTPNSSSGIDRRKLTLWVGAGLQARFDLFGQHG